jgi:hypothetical protein
MGYLCVHFLRVRQGLLTDVQMNSWAETMWGVVHTSNSMSCQRQVSWCKAGLCPFAVMFKRKDSMCVLGAAETSVLEVRPAPP